MNRKDNQWGKWLWRGAFLVFGAVFVISVAGVGRTLWVSRQEDSTFSQLSELVREETAPVKETAAAAEAETEPEEKPESRYKELYDMNPDLPAG